MAISYTDYLKGLRIFKRELLKVIQQEEAQLISSRPDLSAYSTNESLFDEDIDSLFDENEQEDINGTK